MPLIQQPSGQIKLTNVSLVRLKKGKKRFEIACYKNKVLEYRSGLEDDLDEVLQIRNVFLNVSKGQTAPREDLDKAFGKGAPIDDCVLEILNKGELQVGEKERTAQLERVHAEVVDTVAAKLVDPESRRVYTAGMIAKALDQLSAASAQRRQEHAEATRAAKRDDERRRAAEREGGGADGGEDGAEDGEEDDAPAGGAAAAEDGDHATTKDAKPLWTGVSATKSAKSQALDAMRALIAWQPIPVARARMRLRVSCHVSVLKQQVKAAPAAAPGGEAPAKEGKAGKKGGKKGGGAAPAAAPPPAADADPDADDKARGAGGTVKDRILSYFEEVVSQGDAAGDWEVVGFAEPGAFKPLNDFIGSETKGKGRIEVLDMAVKHED